MEFKLAVKCIGICILILLFFGSFSYTFIVYFKPEEKELEGGIDIDQICRPYNLQDRQTSNPEIGYLLQNISVKEIYTDHPMCLDVVLPVMCSLAYAVMNEDDLDMSGGGTINSDNLLEVCNLVLPRILLLLATRALPRVNFLNITCANGFYLLNYTCRPHCTQFEQLYHSTATTKIGVVYFSTISNAILTSLFLVLVIHNRKTMLKMPSVLFLYIVVLYSVWPLCILINLLSGRTLVCSDDDLIKSLQQPSAYCVISAIIIALPYIITITVNEDFFPVQSGFPTTFCSSRNQLFNFSYVVFSSVFLCSLGLFLLMIILFHMQMRFGWSIWRKDVVINTAEKKILLLLFIVGCVAALNGIFYTLSVTAQTKLSRALNDNFLCELPGYIVDKENDMTTCSKDELEKYSYIGLSYMTTIFIYALLPLYFYLLIFLGKILRNG